MSSPTVFLSYSHGDRELAHWFERALSERGVAVWIDREGIRGGDRFHRVIEEAVKTCQVVVVLLSRAAVESNWVDAEWQQALDAGQLVIPVVLEDCAVPRVLMTRQVVDATSDRVVAVERIATRVASGWRPTPQRVSALSALRDEQLPGGSTGIGYRAHREEPTLNLVKALLFPFRNVHDLWRLVPIGFLLTFVPPLGVLMARGFRLDVVRRSGVSDPEPIPRAKEAGRHFLLGLMLALLRTLFLVPAIALLLLFGALAAWELVVETAHWLAFSALGWGTPTTLRHVVSDYLVPAVLHSLAPLAYLCVAWPLYRACIIRYALTGKSSSLFELHKASALVVQHLDGFLTVFLVWFMVTASMLCISLPLIATGVGILGVSGILAPFYYCMTAYLYGALAVRVRERIASRPLTVARTNG